MLYFWLSINEVPFLGSEKTSMSVTKDGIDLNVCAYCNEAIDEFSRTVDHLYPKSRGGILSNNNKVPACGNCNKLKANMNVKEFYRALGSLMFFESTSHRERYAYLKKVRANTAKLIDTIKDGKKHSLRHNPNGRGQSVDEKKKRP